MRNFIATTFALSLVAATAAFAQGTGSSSATKSTTPSASSKPIGSAPVGHRQPTVADVGSEKNAIDLSAEDKALDRKIKSICRGC
jgi:hypothetical protein